jgi:exopolyphosphatase/guanosine-5'-triphosphate,3'-diphosphate pyrophosphatase
VAHPFAVAGVDVGSNSVLMTVARRGPDGRLLVLDERCVITRLGRGLGDGGRLSPEAAAATLAVLEEAGRAALALGAKVRAAGTSALRRATDAESFLARAERALGAPVELLRGEDEARLGWRGALSDLPGVEAACPPILLDPGGGSTEVTRPPEAPRSFEVGAVRLTEEFLHHDPPTEPELAAMDRHIDHVLAPLRPARGRLVVAAGGTATTLAAVDLGLVRYDGRAVHGHRVSVERIAALADRLAALPTAERERIPCVAPGRADIAPAGARLLLALLRRLGAAEFVVSDRGLRFGLIEEMLEGTRADR